MGKASPGTGKHYILPLNNIVGLPGEELTFSLQNNDLIELVRWAKDKEATLFTVCRHSFQLEVPVSLFGVRAKVLEILPADKNKVRFRLGFADRMEMTMVQKDKRGYHGEGQQIQRRSPPQAELQALKDEFRHWLAQLAGVMRNTAPKVEFDRSQPDPFITEVARYGEFSLEDRQTLLEGWSPGRRLKTCLELLGRYLKVHTLRQQLRKRTNDRMRRMEREALLTEERRIIDKELGKAPKDSCPPELQGLKDQISVFSGPEEVRAVLDKEFERLLRTGLHSPHASTIQDYLDALLDLPWDVHLEPRQDWSKVEEVLTQSHFGLERIKERILRYLSVVSITRRQPGMILCLVGPPGVGKTSFAKAISEALELPFVKKSLGGVRDESEIRGHRRTYIGALPGRIVQGLRKARCSNPVFLLDEVDKLGKDHRGDPASALLEVLDPEENHRFSDHYLEVDLDLSKVFWVLTANSEEEIPGPLRDRLEIIRFSGYTETEKRHIASDYLCKRCMEQQGLPQQRLNLSDALIRDLIRLYTREAGVRELQRKISQIVQYLALRQARGGHKGGWRLAKKDLSLALGPPMHVKPQWTKTSWTPGVMAGLAWTASGGTVLRLECSPHPGKGELKLTGKLGEVMKESAHTAHSFLKTHSAKLQIDLEGWKDLDFHIHIPAGATPKEGPSAGLGLALLLTSAALGSRCRPFWALTGEITLHGVVLPIGGVKEKLLAACQEGFQGVLLPESNRSDVEEIRLEELEQLDIRYVSTFWEAYDFLFGDAP